MLDDMSESAENGHYSCRIGVLDNDRCALDNIVALLEHLNNRDGRRLDIWASDNPAQAIQECRFGSQHTDVIFVDMALTGLTGVQVATQIRRFAPTIAVIGMTSYEPRSYRRQLQQSGAQALLDKSTLRRDLCEALDSVVSGDAYPRDSGFVGTSQAPIVYMRRDRAAMIPKFTATEQRFISLSTSHDTAKQLAAQLSISVDTVFSHRRNIKKKLHCDTWHEALDKCRELHIL
jgi:DNA-binding NarL/FixJ family response regulator